MSSAQDLRVQISRIALGVTPYLVASRLAVRTVLILLILKMAMACSVVSLTRPVIVSGSGYKYAVGSTAPSGCLGRGKLGARMQSRSWIKASGEPRRDCFRRDAVLGRKPAGGARRLGPPHSEDDDGLLRSRPVSASTCFWLRVQVRRWLHSTFWLPRPQEAWSAHAIKKLDEGLWRATAISLGSKLGAPDGAVDASLAPWPRFGFDS